MELQKLKHAADTITMPDDMKHRIVRNCRTQIYSIGKESTMKNNVFRKSAAVAAAVVICLSLSVTALAATGVLKGSFRDIMNWQGAVVGTSYEQATDEISMSVTVNGQELTVQATFADPQMAPYVYSERLGITHYRIVDENGKAVKEGAAESVEVVNGQAAVKITLDDIDCGRYKLIVSAFVSEKKADQPLNINGNWECVFTK